MIKFPDFSLNRSTFPKFPDFSLPGKLETHFPGFPVKCACEKNVWIILVFFHKPHLIFFTFMAIGLLAREINSRQTRNNCITFVQRRPNVFDVGPTLYKCYTNVCVCWAVRYSYLLIVAHRYRDPHNMWQLLIVIILLKFMKNCYKSSVRFIRRTGLILFLQNRNQHNLRNSLI